MKRENFSWEATRHFQGTWALMGVNCRASDHASSGSVSISPIYGRPASHGPSSSFSPLAFLSSLTFSYLAQAVMKSMPGHMTRLCSCLFLLWPLSHSSTSLLLLKGMVSAGRFSSISFPTPVKRSGTDIQSSFMYVSLSPSSLILIDESESVFMGILFFFYESGYGFWGFRIKESKF